MATGSTLPAAASTAGTTRGVAVQPSAVVTSGDLTSALAAQSIAAFGPRSGPVSGEVVVNSEQRFQPFYGVGGALTDSAAYCMMTYLTQAQRTALLTEMYGTNGWSTVRVCLGSGGFNYSPEFIYEDDSTDPNFTKLSIAADGARVIPILQEILAINPRCKVILSNWSPPSWMKANSSIIGGAMVENTTNYNYLAQFFVQVLKQFAAYGIPTWAITPQNEPANNTAGANYAGATWTAAGLAAFIAVLGPALVTAGFNPKILVGDDNWNNVGPYATAALGTAASAPYTTGIAWHGYGGNPALQVTYSAPYPTKEQHFTEYRTLAQTGSAGPATTFTQALADMVSNVGIASVRFGCSSITLWNLALDQNGGPSSAGSTGRRGVVTINNSTGAITRNPEFFMLSHIGAYVKPGAVRCDSTNFSTGTGQNNPATDISTVAFVNPDGSVVAVLYNGAASTKSVPVTDAVSGMTTFVSVPAGAVASVTWSGAQPAAAASIAAPSAPTSPSATAGKYKITLGWTAGSGIFAGYRVLRGTAAGGAKSLIATLLGSAVSFVDSIAAPDGNPLYYAIQAYGAGGLSAASTEVSATAQAGPYFNNAPATTGNVGSAYGYRPSVSGGTTPYTYALTGTLPAGLSFSTSTGVISGSPTTVTNATGLQITVTDSAGTPASSSTAVFNINVSAAAALVVDSASSANTGGNATVLSYNHTIASDANLLVVGLGYNVPSNAGATSDIASTITVTAGGIALTRLDTTSTTGRIAFERGADIWYLLNPPTGVVPIVVSTPLPSGAGAAQSTTAVSQSYKYATSAPFGTTAKAASTAAGGATSESVTTTGGTANGQVFGVASARSSTVPTLGGGQTSVYSGLNGTNLAVNAFNEPGGTGTITSSATITTADSFALLVAPLKSAA